MQITVTRQERFLAKYLREQDAEVFIDNLITGDAWFSIKSTTRRVGFEVKSTQDLVASFVGKRDKNGQIRFRLKEQLTRMLQEYQESVLLIWDWMEPQKGMVVTAQRINNVNWDAMWGALTFWQRRGIILDFGTSREHAAHRIIMHWKHHNT